jgi:hypothetical protein
LLTDTNIAKINHGFFGFATSRQKTVLFLLIAFLPVLFYLYIISTYTVNIPSSDDYDMLTFFEQFRNQPNIWEKIKLLFVQHSEHRIVFNRVVLLLSYYLTGSINFKWLIIMGNISLLLLIPLFYKALRVNNHTIYYFLPVPFLLVHLQYYENATWALASLQNFSVILFSYLSLYYLCLHGWWYFVLAAILAAIATFTSGSGLFTFLPGIFLLIIQKQYKRKLPVWIIVFLACALLYFYDYRSIGEQPGMVTSLVKYPHKIVIYFVSFLGSALHLSGNFGYYIAIAAGFAFCAFFLYLFRIGYYQKNPFIFSLMLLVLITAAAAAVSRYGSGVQQALLSRYKIHSSILLVLSYVAILDVYGKKIKPFQFAVFAAFCLFFNILSNVRNTYTVYLGGKNLLFGAYALKADNPTNVFLSFHDKEKAQRLLTHAQQQGFYKFPDNLTPLEKSTLHTVDLPQEGEMINAGFDITEYNQYYMIHNGWATFKEYNSVGVEIFVVLKTSDRSYIFDTYPSLRPDVTAFFSTLNFDNSGFTCLIDKNDIANGTYQVGLYLSKKGKVKAFQYTGKVINHINIQPVEPVNLSLPVPTNNIMHNLDEWVNEGDATRITGWAVINGQDTDNMQKFIVLQSDNNRYVFPTMTIDRPDVSRTFNSPGYNKSGYTVKFKKANVAEGNYQIGMYLVKDTIQALQYLNKYIEIRHLKPVHALQKYLPDPTNNIDGSIDTWEEEGTAIKLSGWAAISNHDAINSKIYIILQSDKYHYVYPTTLVKRPDVTKNFQTLDYDDAGYSTTFDKSILAEGSYKVGILIEKDTIQAYEYTIKKLEIRR